MRWLHKISFLLFDMYLENFQNTIAYLCYEKLLELGVWICRVFIIFLLHLVWVTAWNVLTL